jgi:hypothetical protein
MSLLPERQATSMIMTTVNHRVYAQCHDRIHGKGRHFRARGYRNMCVVNSSQVHFIGDTSFGDGAEASSRHYSTSNWYSTNHTSTDTKALILLAVSETILL